MSLLLENTKQKRVCNTLVSENEIQNPFIVIVHADTMKL